MPMKFKKLHETATLEAGATIPRAFNYKTAFFVFIACLLIVGALVFLVIQLVTMNQITTTYAEAVPSVERDVIAMGEGEIVSMKVSYGDVITKGQELFEIIPLKESADQAKLDALQAKVEIERERLKLLKEGANLGGAILNDVQRRYNDAEAALKLAEADVKAEKANLTSVGMSVAIFVKGKQRELKEAQLRSDRARKYYLVAEENFNKAKEYYTGDVRLITLDKFTAAENELKIRELEKNFAEQQVEIYREAVEDAKEEGEARKDAQKNQIAKAESIRDVRKQALEAVRKEKESLGLREDGDESGRGALIRMQERLVRQAELELKKFRREKGYGVYRAPFTGKVGWIQRKQADTVGPGDFIMKLFSSEGMEIQARLEQNNAGRLAKGQEVDVKVNTEEGNKHIKGRIEAITNQFYTLRPDVRERVRIENPTAEMNLIVVRISLEGKEKEILYPGDPVTVTIYTTRTE
ncbi:MAG: hypothetical protein DRP79_06305 [Planctomycetota bacterium]|nr:MAG: hypothetical protein DRP79_06305 [Planctomycetota bacterium]